MLCGIPFTTQDHDVHRREAREARKNSLANTRIRIEYRGLRSYNQKPYRGMMVQMNPVRNLARVSVPEGPWGRAISNGMKRLILTLCDIFGISAMFRFLHKDSLTILLYHGVAPYEERGARAQASIYNYRGKFIDPMHFERQMRYLARRYHIVGVDDGIQMLRERRLPRRALAITFDDGYRNFYEYAFPILKRMRIPATMFMVSDFILHKRPLWVDRLEYAVGAMSGTKRERIARDAKMRADMKKVPDTEREKRLQQIEHAAGRSLVDFSGERSVYAPLSLDEIQQMRESGITFGAHTKTHPILSTVSAERGADEIRGSRDALEAHIPLSPLFAYPNGERGDWNDVIEQTLAEAGFTGALTTIEGFNTADTHRFALRRMVMDATGGRAFAATASGVRLFLRTLRP